MLIMGKEIEETRVLIIQCMGKLSGFAPEFSINNAMITHQIAQLTHLKQSTKSLNQEQLNLLYLLEDLKKLHSLQPMEIPQEPPNSPLVYYILADSVGGVTEKLSLINASSLKAKLENLLGTNTVTMENYGEVRDQFKLGTEAILKLPKHGNVLEVQREKMALDISNILGLQTTKSTLMDYNGKPALFIPFDNITLLREVATGKTMQARLGSFKKYSHYSTINPVGEALQANAFINEFGHSLGLFYLCSDTDALGGYNQNKALKDNRLFIFDQVISLDDKLMLDSRLSMKPIKLISHHTRHDQGRNRTLIEDASVENKFQALMALKNKRHEIGNYCSTVINRHQTTLSDLSIAVRQPHTKREMKKLINKIKLVKKLLSDAEKLKIKLLQRIDKIDAIFPKSEADPTVIQQALLLEKMLNHPVLFSEDGRPYSNPWANKNTIKALTIVDDLDGTINIKFNSNIPNDVIQMIQRQMGEQTSGSWICSEKELKMSKDRLLLLNESTLFPEHDCHFDAEKIYLSVDDLEVIQHGYRGRNHHKIIALIDGYNKDLLKDPISTLDHMDAIEIKLNTIKENLKNKGFIKHVLKKFHFDAHHIQQLMISDVNKRETINQAFNAALKLDQVSLFSQVVREAIRQDKLDDPVFSNYLTTCIEESNAAIDHFSALKHSENLKKCAMEARLILQNEGDVFYQASLVSLSKIIEIVPEKVHEQFNQFTPEERSGFKIGHPDLFVFAMLYNSLINANKTYQKNIGSFIQSDPYKMVQLGQAYKNTIVQCFTDALAIADPSTWKKIVRIFVELKRTVQRAISSVTSQKSSPSTLTLFAEKKLSSKEVKKALVDINPVLQFLKKQ